MKFLFLIQVPEGVHAPAPGAGDPTVWVEETGSRRLIGNQTGDWSTARTVTVLDGRTLVTDGPFAETKDAIAGFDVIECGSVEEAVEIAAKHPVATFGAVEIRPFVD
ncbi:MAG TPA: YciI family protein [Gaiellaceae bacterium]|jgi:hypothetical protein|nr:YciI family protein [Gaiellaceae bacterium]